MPLFRYNCKSCGHSFEMLVKAPAPDAVPCPECGSADTAKALSRFAPKVASPASSCPHADSCPSAASSGCGCGCGCHHHH